MSKEMVMINKSKKQSSSISKFLLVILFIVIATIATFFTFKNYGDSVLKLTNYKTYTDDSFGFSFKYPSEYNVFPEEKSEFAERTLTITSDPQLRKVMDASMGKYTILIIKKSVGFDQMEEVAKQKYSYLDNLSIESKVVDGHSSFRANGINKKATGSFGQLIDPYQEDIVLIDNGNTYISINRSSESNYDRNEITQIYNSFEFN